MNNMRRMFPSESYAIFAFFIFIVVVFLTYGVRKDSDSSQNESNLGAKISLRCN